MEVNKWVIGSEMFVMEIGSKKVCKLVLKI